MGVTCGAGTTDPSRTHEFIPEFSGVHVAQSSFKIVPLQRGINPRLKTKAEELHFKIQEYILNIYASCMLN
jgi:hypothetical protein